MIATGFGRVDIILLVGKFKLLKLTVFVAPDEISHQQANDFVA